MNQSLALSISLALAIASWAALWPVLTLGSAIQERLEARVSKSRVTLGLAALAKLRDLRVRLDETFEKADNGEDEFLTKTDPEAVLVPVREYTRLVTTSAKLVLAMTAIQRRSSSAFWVLIVFSAVATLSVLSSALARIIGVHWAEIGLVVCGLILVVGAVTFVRIAIPYRQIDKGMSQATNMRLELGYDPDEGSLAG